MRGRERDVAVTGLGLVTPCGTGTAATWRGLCSGVPTAVADERLSGALVDICCPVGEFGAVEALGHRVVLRTDRFTQMALVAAREALADAALSPAEWDPSRVGVVIGVSTGSTESWAPHFASLAAGRPEDVSPFLLPRTVPNMAAAEIAIRFGAQGPGFAVSTACAAGATAIGVARDLVRSGTCDVVVAGGSEAPAVPIVATCFAQMGALSRRADDPAGACRPFAAGRDGFVLGEGAGMLILERPEHATARGATLHARLTGYGASSDAHHITAPHPQGRGAEAAIRAALADAGLAPRDIGHVNAHGTGTVLNDLAEARALRRVFGTPPPVTAVKSIVGHALGGAGAIEAACTVLSLRHGLVPPTANHDEPDPDCDLDVVTAAPRPVRATSALSNAFGFGGQNAVLVFETP
ncbi:MULTISPECIES: beta-ketoacyl-[acyl-carrier-protein] synthase family protein [Streptomyces]|uniref:Beta-ketoacyl-[acyl-carrier-protein] synthase family protein n=1 Tax=Streptomyces griseocarneus TaxID=51201 RepID=A0ABX7RMQ9_9ACTN|nr:MULTISPECIES: beta-ketoacyl-[acyl-carrier-protein] synthase family protein [Streptomyces]QSY49560.1 beta-ketoacyl-[acyl-carrier-protein] synthase family protein [Streptomyces griseocarneus]